MKLKKFYNLVLSYYFLNNNTKSLSIHSNFFNTFGNLFFCPFNQLRICRSFISYSNLSKTLIKMEESCPLNKKLPFDVQSHSVGQPGTKSFSVEFLDSKNNKVSPWHDLPLFPHKDFVTMVVEIPRNTRAKMEIKTELENNPIKQDLFSNGDLRDLDCAMYWNYGAVPQTWEAPVEFTHKYKNEEGKEETVKLVGDNDPLDIIDVGNKTLKIGEVVLMKPVGALALIDQNEIDWKVFAVSPHDEHFHDINELEDIDKYYPGTTTGIMEFFRWYKTPRGKPLNKFLQNKTFVSRKETLELIEQTHEHYKKLLEGKLEKGDLWTKN